MIITRFAPSPTGYLHLGHAYSAILAHDEARRTNGKMLLRIEDIDKVRSKPEYEKAISEDLKWLGLSWPTPVIRQSERMDKYAKALEKLDGMGLVYPCFCTRKEIADEIAKSETAPHGPDGVVYPGLCKTLSQSAREERIGNGEPHAFRLNMEKATARTGTLLWNDTGRGNITATPEIFGDVILARKDTPTSYHLAVTVDDHLQGVTLVIRGEDLFDSTHIHRLLQGLLKLDIPDYFHHPLLTDSFGKRYAKRDKSVTLQSLRNDGITKEEIRRRIGLARKNGWHDSRLKRRQSFSLKKKY